MGTAAGERDRLIGFYPAERARDGHGVETVTHPTLLERAWAKVLFGSGSERRDAGAAGAVQTATFRVVATTKLRSVAADAQIDFEGARWGITSIVPVSDQGSELEFTATRKVS